MSNGLAKYEIPNIADYGGIYDTFIEDDRLREAQIEFLKGVYGGMTPIAAARHAGYSSPPQALDHLKKHALVSQYLKHIISHQREELKVTKARVEGIMLDAVEMARLQGDPATMVRGGAELGRMNGHYAPDVKKIELSAKAARTQSDFEELSTEDLLELAGEEGGIDIVDADFEEITDDPAIEPLDAS